ncbi:ABC transporter ATP-binding protein [Candidatus Neptunochlamydia vexilliferae]|nr:ABC transporter ATP-binding protein [Candidatus Neptunochlamydia vexilliferae]
MSDSCAISYKRILGFLKSSLFPERGKIIAIFLLSICWSSREILVPYLLKCLVDSFLLIESGQQAQPLITLLASMVGVWIIMEICMRIQGAFLLKTLPKVKAGIRTKILERIKSYPYSYFSSEMTGNLSERISGASQGVETLLSIVLVTFVPICALLIASLILLLNIHLLIGIIFSMWLVLHFFITWKMGRSSLPKNQGLAQAKTTLSGKIVDLLANMYVVQSFSRQVYEKKFLQSYEEKVIAQSVKAGKHLEKARLGLGVSGIVILILALMTSFIGWKQGWVSAGEMTFIVVLLLNLTGYLWYMSMEIVRFFEEYGIVLQHFQSILGVSLPKRPRWLEQPSFSGSTLSIKNLYHGFKDGEDVLVDINFSVRAGEKIILSGMSGSGKTTLINLILGHYPLNRGDIFLGNQRITDIPLDVLRAKIGVVPQNPSLFHRTVEENILYGKLGASNQEMIEAAKIAGCHEFIMGMELGYETVVGEKGDRLSGGQKQRIAVARALLKKAPFLILDEPTASMDQKTEEALMKGLSEHLLGTTVILITHQLHLSKYVDRVITLAG